MRHVNTNTSRIKDHFAAALAMFNIFIVTAINVSQDFALFISQAIPISIMFFLIVLSFCAICYLSWDALNKCIQEMAPTGQCIMGFVIPVLTAFIATADWSAFTELSVITSSDKKYLNRFDDFSIFMIFVLFVIGAVTWGLFMKTQDFQDRIQFEVAVGYTVLSYWFGFIVFCWVWLFWTALNSS